MIALRTVASVWQVERRTRNADEIADRAGKLYDKFAGFIADMTAMGDCLNRTQKTYGEAMSKLSTGRGNLVGQAQRLKDLGGRASKSLPAALLEAAEVVMPLGPTPDRDETALQIEGDRLGVPLHLAREFDGAPGAGTDLPLVTTN